MVVALWNWEKDVEVNEFNKGALVRLYQIFKKIANIQGIFLYSNKNRGSFKYCRWKQEFLMKDKDLSSGFL